MSAKGSIPRLKQSLARLLIEAYKAQLRYMPFRIGCEAVWNHLVEPRLWGRRYDFTTRTNFGAKIVGSTEELTQKYALFFGVWEPNLTGFVKRRLRPGNVFVDVGAYFGYYSLLASRLVGKSGSVVAIEASPQNFALLQRNLLCNGVKNVRAIHAAASDRQESIQLYSTLDRTSGCTTQMKEWADRYRLKPICKVPALPLAELLRSEEIRTARLIKIDVEGAEWKVVLGMAEMLPSCRDDIEIIIEVTPLCLEAQGKTFDDLLDVFTPHGFLPYRLDHDVSALSYVRQRIPIRPRRIQGAVLEQTDVVFSRTDADSL